MQRGGGRGRNDWSLALLLIPFIALLYPPWYSRVSPEFEGIPFFVWYQFLWIILGTVVVLTVYWLRLERKPPP